MSATPKRVQPRIAIGLTPAMRKAAAKARWRGLTLQEQRGLKPALTRGERNCAWIERHCRVPDGHDVGKAVVLRDWQAEIILAIYDNPFGTRRAIISFAKKNGKALALDTPIPTPSGWRTIADIQPDDIIYGSDGEPTRVLAISPIFRDKPCYRLGFSDGSSIVASGDHLWTTEHLYRPWAVGRRVSKHGNSGRWRVDTVTTEQIAESLMVPGSKTGARNHKIAIAAPLESADMPLPVSPYVLGAWLGDGSAASARFACGERDVPAMSALLQDEGEGDVEVRRWGGKTPTLAVLGKGKRDCLQARLRNLGVLGRKHIPEAYFSAGTAQRWALLQGLMDTDGCVNQHGGKHPRCSFTNTNHDLAYGCWRLCRSLGLKATIRQTQPRLNGKDCAPAYHVAFTADQGDPVFRLTRKQELLPAGKGSRVGKVSIVSCERVETVPTKCLMVAAADSLFLAGHGCIPTHNTALTAFLVLLHLVGPEFVRNGQLPSTAMSRDQAATLFKLAAACVRQSPTLLPVCTIRDSVKEIFCRSLGTLYKALSADAKTKHGQSPAFAVHDELGQVKGPISTMYDGVENAMGAHAHPLSIIISTQAASDGDLLSLLIDDAVAAQDPETVCIVYAAPEYQEDARGEPCKDDAGRPIAFDPFTDDALRLASPALGDFLNIKEIRGLARNAKRMPSKEALYRNFTLNQRVDIKNPFISRAAWAACAGPALIGYEDLASCDAVYGGLDLSQVRDLTAFVLVGRKGDRLKVHTTCWLPAEGLEEKARQDKTPWDVWAKAGYLHATAGASVNYAFVAAHVYQACQRLPIKRIAYDRWRFEYFQRYLEEAGFRDTDLDLDNEAALFKGFGQGFKEMSPALDALEIDVVNQTIDHGGHPVLTLCAANAVIKTDPAGNRKLSKPDSHGRIDALVALAMARGVAGTYVAPRQIDIAGMIA